MGAPPRQPQIVGRYALFDEIASGGMASVALGRQLGAAGFSRVVAIKRLHHAHAHDPDFVAMFLDEARLAARIRHANVVATIDIVHEADELFLVMEYVDGESLAALMRTASANGVPVSEPIAASIFVGALHGLHAAHEARAEDGSPLGIVHRDVSPQNILVGADGIARVIDFGIARANVRLHQTRDGKIKGKLAYMAPEQITGDQTTALSDVFAAGIVLWELLAGDRVHQVESEGALLARVIEASVAPLRERAPWVSDAVEAVVMKAVAREPAARFASAREMARALESAVAPASSSEVAEWVGQIARKTLAARAARVASIERFGREGGEDERSIAPLAEPTDETTVTAARRAVVFAGAGKASATETVPSARPTPLVATSRTRPRRGAIVAVGAIAIAAAATAGWFVVARPATTDPSSAPEPSAPAVVPSEPKPPPPTVAAEHLDAAPVPPPTVTLDTPPPPSPKPHMSRRGHPAAGAATTPPRPIPACDVPTYQDADGITRVKRECL